MKLQNIMQVMLGSKNIGTTELSKILGVSRQRALVIIKSVPQLVNLLKICMACDYKLYVENEDGSIKMQITLDELK